jgi:hypothetical protein
MNTMLNTQRISQAPISSQPRVYSDASSATPHWRSAINAWSTADPSRNSRCKRILDHIENGLPIDPSSMPIDKHLPNTPTIAENADAVRIQLQHYLAMGAVEPCSRTDIVAVHPLHCVIRPDRKPRVVVDFSLNLNDYLTVPQMQYSSSIDAAVAASKLGCYYSKLDIKDCFLSFSIRKGHERFLGFQFEGKYYRYRRLPFGLNTAPELCELMLSVVSWQLTQKGVTHVRYCDDILIIAPTLVECDRMTTAAALVLDQFGLAVAHNKTIKSVQLIDFLGIRFDSINGTLSCPPQRIIELTSLLQRALQFERHMVKFILSLVGKLSYAAHVLPGARPFFRSLIDITRGLSKRNFIVINDNVRSDIRHWLKHMSTWNGRQQWRTTEPIKIATDASLSGWGGLVISSPVSLPSALTVGAGTAGVWCRQHPITSSSDIGWAELFAVLFMVASIAPAAPNSTILCLVDNQADAAIINRQSTRSTSLLSLLRSLYSVTTEHNISLIARHIPGSSNTYADALSRNLPLPSPLAPLVVRCSCEVPPVMVQWYHPSSPSSRSSPCGMVPTRPTPASSVIMNGSVPIPVPTPSSVLPKPVYVKQQSTSVRNGQLMVSQATSQHYSGGIQQPVTANSQGDTISRRSKRVLPMSMVSSTNPNQHLHYHYNKFTPSIRSLIFDRSTTPVTGVRSSLASSVSSESANTRPQHQPRFISASSMLPSTKKVFHWLSRTAKPALPRPPSASAPAMTSSALLPHASTIYHSSVVSAPPTSRSSSPHPIPPANPTRSHLIPLLNGSSYKQFELV